MIDILCKKIIKELEINRIVETGTDKGETVAETCRWFAEIHPEFGKITGNVKTASRSYSLNSTPMSYPIFADAQLSRYKIYSVDLDEHSYKTARERFSSNPNICVFHSCSRTFLKSILDEEAGESNNYLFFLDAHWGKYWPLRDEIKEIQKLDRYIIVIDDCFVPGKSDAALPHGDFGFDLYEMRILSWGYICDLFEGMPVRVFYPQASNPDQRGWVLLTYGYTEEGLKFLQSLPFFELAPTDKRHTAEVKTVWRSHLDAKNLLKTIVSINFLRAMHRVYERILS